MNTPRTPLRGLLLGLFLLALCWASPTSSAPITAVYGANVACDQASTFCHIVPSSASLLCDGTGANLNCPQFFAPDWVDTSATRFFGITNRTNPSSCVQSTDGGTTWVLCPSNPFVGATDGLGSFFAVASDGSLIAVDDQGANNCFIKRSTNYGVSWSTAFSDAAGTVTCAVSFGSPTSNTARCSRSSGYCVVIGRTVGTFDLIAYFSSNNGASWTKGTAFNIVSADEEIGIQIADDGNSGSLTRYAGNTNTAGRVFASTSGSDWTTDGLIPDPPGVPDGDGIRCSSGAFMFGGQSVICGPTPTFPTRYNRFTHGAGSTAFASSFTVPSGLTFAQTPDIMAVGFDGSTAYLIGRNVANTNILIHQTRDSFNTTTLLSTLVPTTALIGGCCRGDVVSWQGAIYFSIGAVGANAVFGRIS